MASLGTTGCRHRASACAVSPRLPPEWLTDSLKQHKTLTKHNFYLDTGAFLKTLRHKNIGHKTQINIFLTPIICMSVIKIQICRTSPPRSANLCPDISLTYIFISPLNVTSLVTKKSRTPPPHATATAFVARCRSPPPPPRSPQPHATAATAFVAHCRSPPPPPRSPPPHATATRRR